MDRCRGLVAVSRFFCFPIQMNFAENQKWPTKVSGRAVGSVVVGQLLLRACVQGGGPVLGYRVCIFEKVVKRRGFLSPNRVGGKFLGR